MLCGPRTRQRLAARPSAARRPCVHVHQRPSTGAYRPSSTRSSPQCCRRSGLIFRHSIGVATRLLTLYQLESDPRFLTVQKMLLYFEQTDLFPSALPLIEQERLAIDAHEHRLDLDALLKRKETLDLSQYADFTARDHAVELRFSALTLQRQREYLNLWNRSEFLVRRQFYFSVRALVMIAAYSMDEVWSAIGYDGPVLPRSRV